MKTALSIDDGLLREADDAARRMHVSRSRFFALAITDFLQRARRDEMLRRLNELYTNESAEKPLIEGIKAKVRRTNKDRW